MEFSCQHHNKIIIISRRRGSVWECLNHPWILPQVPDDILSRQAEIHMDNLRNYQARKRWKHSMKVRENIFVKLWMVIEHKLLRNETAIPSVFLS